MSKKELRFCVFDCETATLPFANEIAKGDAEAKKRIAIARPLIYDVGWTITNRRGEILDKKQFLIAETFSVPQVFNTAYYREKRPIYLGMLSRREITVKPWDEVMEIFINDLEAVDSVGAFNSMFDFKKAIPFTELYIRKLYSPDYEQWEAIQRAAAYHIAWGKKHNEHNPEFEPDVFRFRGRAYPLFDLWGLAVNHLLDNVTYKQQCLEHDLLTASGTFFKSSAESTYRYLCDKYDFMEAHMALNDAEIETFILSKIAARHKIKSGIEYFPFRNLGYTYDFVRRKKKPNREEVEKVYNAILTYCLGKEDSAYVTGLKNKLNMLAELLV